MKRNVNLTLLSFYMAALEKSQHYNLNAHISLSIGISKNVSFTNTFAFTHDTTLESIDDKSHLQLTSGLTWSF